MSAIRIQYQIYYLRVPPPPIPTEILNTEFERIHYAEVDQEREFPVAAGTYLVRGKLPSGELVSSAVQVGTDEVAEVSLTASASRHEWLSWQHLLGTIPKTLMEQKKRGWRKAIPWLRLWVRQNRSWKLVDRSIWLAWQDLDAELGMANYLLRPPGPGRLAFLQFGGSALPWRFLALPPTRAALQVIIQPANPPTERNGGLTISVNSEDRQVEAMLQYTRRGATDAAELLSKGMEYEVAEMAGYAANWPEEQAIELFRDKLQNPNGAAVAGYYLLKTGRFDRLRNWPDNFARWVNWLPDSAIIHAWVLLRQAKPDLRLARRRLLEAVRRGLPIYTEGMRLLIDGLELFTEEARTKGRHEPKIEQALMRLRAFAAGLDWNQPLLSFYGKKPDQPESELVTGDCRESKFTLKVRW